MHTRITMLLGTVVLLLGVLSLAQPAAAAPAEPYETSTCKPVFGNTHVLCVTEQGVVQENESASGITKVTMNGTRSSTLYRDDGSVRIASEEKFHETLIAKDGEAHVAHTRESRTVKFSSGVTCTYDVNVIYANGEVRHEIDNVECS